MNFALIYIAARAFYRFAEFWRHWYFESFSFIARFTLNILERLDRLFAVKINFRLLFQPLYQDYSVVGRILGPLFRFVSISIGSLIYAVIGFVAIALYVLWVALPLFIVYKAFS